MTLEIVENNGVKEFVFHGRSYEPTKEKNQLLAPYGKMIFNCGVVLNLIPTDTQFTDFNQQIGNARVVRNNYLEKRNEMYKDNKAILSVSDYKKNYLPSLKEEKPYLKLSDKFALESAVERVDDAYQHMYDNIKKGKKGKQIGFPKFATKYKPSGNSYTTKFTNNNIELLMENNLPYIKLPKIGKVRFVLPQNQTINTILPFNGRITSATIKKCGSTYTVSLQVEGIIDIPEKMAQVNINDIVAIDMGIKDFGIFGNKDFATKIKNPRFMKVHEKRIRKLNKSLARKKKGSKNWQKAKAKLAKEHRKLKNQRRDFHHKWSRILVDHYDVFICEDLNIKGLVKNHKLAKEISSCGWGQFLNYVKYKMERKGGIFIKIDRFYPSSKTCGVCGYKNDELTLKDRYWKCPACGTLHDRDVNAKNTILDEGLRILTTINGVIVIGV